MQQKYGRRVSDVQKEKREMLKLLMITHFIVDEDITKIDKKVDIICQGMYFSTSAVEVSH
jgi:hypothetical protein